MTEAPAIHPWAARDLAKLRESGIKPTDDDVVWLASLAALAHRAPGRDPYIDTTSPLLFCGGKYWPMTIRAQHWFVRWYGAFEGYPRVRVGVYLFAHAHSRPGDKTLHELGDMAAVEAAVADWMSGLSIREDQLPDLQAALAAMAPSDDTVDPPKETTGQPEEETIPTSLEERVASLCAAFEGTTPGYWMDEIGAVQAEELVAAKVAAENGGVWANSPLRTRRIASYKNAVKHVAKKGLAVSG